MMTIVLYSSAFLRVVIALLVAFKLTWRFHRLGCLERLGLALFGGSSLLTTAPILVRHPTPYDDWAGLTFGLGVALYLLGKLIREWHYDVR
jgi:hypothetical protein